MWPRFGASLLVACTCAAACSSSSSGPVGSTTAAASASQTKSFCTLALGAPACKPFASTDACASEMGIFNEAFVNAMMSCSVDQGCLALGTQALYLGPSFDSTCSKIALNQVDGAPGLSPDVSHCAQQNDSCKDEYAMDAAQSATIHGTIAEHCPAFVTLTSDARGRAARCADLPCPDFESCLGDVFGVLPPAKSR